MIATTLALLAVLAAAPAAPATGPTGIATPAPDALRARVEAYLGVLDRPIPEASWRALGPGAVPILEEIARTSPASWRRANALLALAILGGERAEGVLLAHARDGSAPWSVRAAAARGAGHLLPADRALAGLRPVLERDRDPRVRAVAAEALARRAGPAGCAAVRAQAAREPGRGALYGRALRACGG
jgi:HEAT repeat protein